MPLRSGGAAQSFVRLCNTDFPSGEAYGNPGIHDILKLYMPTLEDCITTCAAYNVQYQTNSANGIPGGGLCRSVAIIKTGECSFRDELVMAVLTYCSGRVLLLEERHRDE